ncbi:MAG: cytidylate kinase-like family protein [Chloroflexi bacterium]|nr:cytidylate kinase-like family protein [Chloroflexota bacterium]
MPVVTIAGRFGSPARAIGLQVARILGADYVDNQILANAASRVGAPIEEMAQKDERKASGKRKLARFFQNFLEKSAAAGSAGDPFLGPTGIEVLMSRSLTEAAQPPHSTAEQLDDQRYIDAITSVILDEAKGDNAVLIGRGSNVILKDLPHALHIYIVSSLESRIESIMRRERLNREDAARTVKNNEEGRTAYYKKFFKVSAEDPVLYHLFLNSDRLGAEHTATIVADAAKEVSRQPVRA